MQTWGMVRVLRKVFRLYHGDFMRFDKFTVKAQEAIVGAHDRQSAGPAEPGQPAEARDRVGSGISQAHQIADQELIEPLLPNQGRESLGAA